MPNWGASLTPETVGEYVVGALEGRPYPLASEATEALEVLLDWLDWADDDNAVEAVDTVVTDWIREHWSRWHPSDRDEAVAIARAWSLVGDLGVQLRGADRARDALRDRLDERPEYLGPLSTGPSLDPSGRVLAAAATDQRDRALAPVWWSVLAFPDALPIHHLRYGFAGLMEMPRADSERGRFPMEVADGLIAAGRGLVRACDAQRMSEERARRAFLRLAGRGLARFPKRSWWEQSLAQLATREPLTSWVQDAFPALRQPAPRREQTKTETPSRFRRRRVQTPIGRDAGDWAGRARQIRAKLEKGDMSAVAEGEALVADQRRHAEQTGEFKPLVQTLSNVGAALHRYEPEIALAWGEEARDWDPRSPYAWSLILRSTWSKDGPVPALRTAVEATTRVPESAVLWHELGQVLRALDCFVQAEEVFRWELELFPNDQPLKAHSALGEVLLRMGRFTEAAGEFETVRALDPMDEAALRGLARAWRAEGLAELAASRLEQWIRPDSSTFLWNELAHALSAAGRSDAAAEVESRVRARGADFEASLELPVTEAVLSFSTEDPEALEWQSRILRRAALRGHEKRDELLLAAEEVLRANGGMSHREIAHVEHALLLLAQGRSDDATATVSEGIARFPASVVLHHASAQVVLDSVHRDPVYSPERFHQIIQPYRRLVELNTALRPVADVGAARAALSLQNGKVGDNAAKAAIDRITSWDLSANLPAYRLWWQGQARRIVLGTAPDADEVEHFRERVTSNERILDQLEQDLVTRFVAAV